ncbi:UNVERIFIED_CONTAM: putative uncharacterized protein DDB [Sesamum angustifolium]|uniref:Uncharacterized protein n=1 Tax=Sesamum angustifolium TaxID=2727405 RepID=A0AAW2PAG0_9LAMI
MAAEEEVDITVSSCLHMVSAFLAMEPPDFVISFAREFGEGSITESVQSCIWHHCITKANDDGNKGNFRVLKTISFLFPNESSGISICPKSMKFEVRLQSSVNMLEGDTGCSIWPSSLFLSEFILSFPDIFANKCCFEVGSGVGLVGISLSYVKASKVILSDGDLSTLANMKINLELNHLSTDDLVHQKKVHCICLPWESASEDDLRCFTPDIILGADIIYDPSCLPHLVRVLSLLLKHNKHAEVGAAGRELDSLPADELLRHPLGKGPVAYVASVVRNIDTFNYFLSLAEQAKLVVTDLTGKVGVSKFLPYLRSYQRSTIRIFRIHV